MKEQINIPTGKISRAANFAGAGVKIGTNYLKYYVRKALDSETTKEGLNEENAEDVYETLSRLKGSALKVAQMLSMDKNILPAAYQNKFQLAQYSAPPLSYPLVVKTFRKELGQEPAQVFDEFTRTAANAASIGQVHKAVKGAKIYAVKVQYPGIAESVKSDLKLVKPMAVRLLNLKGADVDRYFQEMESKLLEETDYKLELQQSLELSEACAHISGIRFPEYFPDLSTHKILTMEWIEGKPLSEFASENKDQALADTIGQTIWDFYTHQIFVLRKMHADPHPGNFIVTTDKQLAVIDFGCVKSVEPDFHQTYFRMLNPLYRNHPEIFESSIRSLEYLLESDSEEMLVHIREAIREMLEMLGQPFSGSTFDFGDDTYFKQLYEFGEKFARNPILKKANGARGPKDALYINRTCFGLFSILNLLKAKVDTSAAVQSLNNL